MAAVAVPPTPSSVPLSLLTPPAEENLINKQLPDELLLYIFLRYLSPADLVSASNVCHRWAQIASDRTLLPVILARGLGPEMAANITIVPPHILSNFFKQVLPANIPANIPSITDKIPEMLEFFRRVAPRSANRKYTVFVIPPGLWMPIISGIPGSPFRCYSANHDLFKTHNVWKTDVPPGVYVMSDEVFCVFHPQLGRRSGELSFEELGFPLPNMMPLIFGILARYFYDGTKLLPHHYSRCIEEYPARPSLEEFGGPPNRSFHVGWTTFYVPTNPERLFIRIERETCYYSEDMGQEYQYGAAICQKL